MVESFVSREIANGTLTYEEYNFIVSGHPLDVIKAFDTSKMKIKYVLQTLFNALVYNSSRSVEYYRNLKTYELGWINTFRVTWLDRKIEEVTITELKYGMALYVISRSRPDIAMIWAKRIRCQVFEGHVSVDNERMLNKFVNLGINS